MSTLGGGRRRQVIHLRRTGRVPQLRTTVRPVAGSDHEPFGLRARLGTTCGQDLLTDEEAVRDLDAATGNQRQPVGERVLDLHRVVLGDLRQGQGCPAVLDPCDPEHPFGVLLDPADVVRRPAGLHDPLDDGRAELDAEHAEVLEVLLIRGEPLQGLALLHLQTRLDLLLLTEPVLLLFGGGDGGFERADGGNGHDMLLSEHWCEFIGVSHTNIEDYSIITILCQYFEGILLF